MKAERLPIRSGAHASTTYDLGSSGTFTISAFTAVPFIEFASVSLTGPPIPFVSVFLAQEIQTMGASISTGGQGYLLSYQFCNVPGQCSHQTLTPGPIAIVEPDQTFSFTTNGALIIFNTSNDPSVPTGGVIPSGEISLFLTLPDGLSITPTPTPTPLPAALPLFATGLGALGLLGWKRKQATTVAA